MSLKPLPPIKPPEKLPKTFHLTMVSVPERGARWWSVVLTEQQADKIVRRKVMETVEDRQLALDELMRVATRVFWFEEGADLVEET